MSYIVLELVIILLLLIFTAMIGIIATSIIIAMISLGMIRITPLIDKLNEFIHTFFPESCNRTAFHMNKTFRIEGSVKNERSIYLFHPHGAFSASYFFHSCTLLTNWKALHPFKTTISRYFFWLPFAQEFCDRMGVVSNVYWSMKKVLNNNESLHIIPGGTSEIPFTQAGKMKIKLLKRSGIFRLALETGTPLVPVLTYGENELYTLMFPKFQKWLQQKFHLVFPLPCFSSIKKWLSLLVEPLENPIKTYIGESIPVEKNSNPTDIDVDILRNKYIKKLKELYRNTKPSTYEKELEVV